MGRFARSRGKLFVHLDPDEQRLLIQSITEFLGLLEDGGEPEAADELAAEDDEQQPADPFELWEKSFGASPSIEDDPLADMPADAETDPVWERLFPTAYADDPEAASDFRRFTEPEQRQAKVEAALVVLDDLDEVRRGVARVPAEHLDAWLKTLNNLRLVLSVMLGITDEISNAEAAQRPDEDPRSWLYSFYGWLGWMLESLLECMLTER